MSTTEESQDPAAPWTGVEEHAVWRRTVRDFAEEVVRPLVRDRTTDSGFEDEIVPRLGELGVFGLRVSERYGGTGAAAGAITSLCIALEELARIDSSVAATVHT